MHADIKIKNLSFAYDKTRKVLNNLNLEVKAGEKIGIIGPMGAGKSTLLLHLNGLLMGQGTIEIGGVAVTKNTLSEIRRKVGIVFQNPDDQLFSSSVEEDIAFGPLHFGYDAKTISEMVTLAIEKLNLKGYEKRVPHQLSLGEKKRVALATVLATKPHILAFDEPFANLDSSMVKQLVNTLKQLPSTVVVVSQSLLPLAVFCDRIAILNQGHITNIGTAKDILSDDNLLNKNGLDLSFYKKICHTL